MKIFVEVPPKTVFLNHLQSTIYNDRPNIAVKLSVNEIILRQEEERSIPEIVVVS